MGNFWATRTHTRVKTSFSPLPHAKFSIDTHHNLPHDTYRHDRHLEHGGVQKDFGIGQKGHKARDRGLEPMIQGTLAIFSRFPFTNNDIFLSKPPNECSPSFWRFNIWLATVPSPEMRDGGVIGSIHRSKPGHHHPLHHPPLLETRDRG